MKITRLYIDGFGIFHDLTRDLDPGLTVLLGDNESGKTTIYDFIRQMMFGLATPSLDDYHLPLNGGLMGGRLTFEVEDGSVYVLERVKRKATGTPDSSVKFPDGSMHDFEEISPIISPGDEALFKNVFSFSLSELCDLKTLSSDKTTAALLGASWGLGSVSLVDVEKGMCSGCDNLFLPSSTTKPVNKSLAEAAELNKKIDEASSQLDRYDEMMVGIDQLENEVGNLRDEVAEERALFTKTDCLVKAFEPYSALVVARERLGEIRDTTGFPNDGLKTHEEHRSLAESLTAEIEKAESQRDKLLQQAGALTVDQGLLDNEKTIDKLSKDYEVYKGAKEDLPLRESELSGKQKGFDDTLSHIGQGWDKEKLLAFSETTAARDAASKTKKQMDDISALLKAYEINIGTQNRELQELQVKRDAAKNALDKAPAPACQSKEELHGKRKKLSALSASLTDLEQRSITVQGLTAAREATKPYVSDTARLKRRLLVAATVFLAAGLLAGVALGLVKAVLGAVIGAAGILLGGGCLLVRYWLGRLETGTTEAEAQPVPGQQAILDYNRAKEYMEHLFAQEGLTMSRASLEAARDQVEADLDYLNDWQALARASQEADAAYTIKRSALENVKEERDKAAENAGKVEERWNEGLSALGLLPGLSPDAVVEILHQIERGRDQARDIDDYNKRIVKMRSVISEFEQALGMVMDACGRIPDPTGDVVLDVNGLERGLRESTRNLNDRSNLERQAEELKDDIDLKMQQRDGHLEEIENLVSQAGCADEEEFLARGCALQEKESRQEEIEGYRDNVRVAVGPDADVDEVIAELDGNSKADLERERTIHEQEATALDKVRDQKLDELGQARKELQEVTSREDVYRMQDQLEALKASISSEAERWAVFRTMQFVLSSAKKEYQQKEQPEVVREAKGFFEKITGGAYTEISLDFDNNVIEAEAPNGGRKVQKELSRGTAEQLYLSLRFGYIKNLASKGRAYPVVVDEALVNFDPDRASAAIQGFLELAATHQVLLFTCHPYIKDIAVALEPAVTVVTM